MIWNILFDLNKCIRSEDSMYIRSLQCARTSLSGHLLPSVVNAYVNFTFSNLNVNVAWVLSQSVACHFLVTVHFGESFTKEILNFSGTYNFNIVNE
jgi:hypothetical protein